MCKRFHRVVLTVLVLGAPGLFCSPFALILPVPCRFLLGFLWITVPTGQFLFGRLGEEWLPRSIRWPAICLLGWCAASVLTLLTILVGGSWLFLGALIGGCGLLGILLSGGRPSQISEDGHGSQPPPHLPLRPFDRLRTAQAQDNAQSLEPETDSQPPPSLPQSLGEGSACAVNLDARRILLVGLTVVALVYALRVGGFMAQDGRYHLGYILEVQNRQGPGMAHPFLDSDEIDPRYSVSSYHSLLAFLAVFSRIQHVDVWFYLPCVWLLLGVGIWRLFGIRVFSSRPLGETCAVFFVLLALFGFTGESAGFQELRTLAYPGGLAFHVLLPALIAWSWRRGSSRIWSVVLISLIALTSAATHLYYCLLALLSLYAGGLGLTVFAGDRRRLKRIAVSAVVASLAASPILIWGWLHYEGAKNPAFVFDIPLNVPHDYRRHVLPVGNELYILRPEVWLFLTGLNAYISNAPLLGIIFLLFFWTKTNKESRAFFAGVVVVPIVLMIFPPLFVWITRTITLYKSFRLFQVLPVIPLLAIGVQGISTWVVLLRRKSPGQNSGTGSHPWLPVFTCLAVFAVAVPDLQMRTQLLVSGWTGVEPWGRQPYRDFTDPLTFPAYQEIACKGYRGTILAQPHAAFAYAALFGGRVVAIPDFHAAPTSEDISERIETVGAICAGWDNVQDLQRAIRKYEIGMAFCRWSQLAPLGEAALSACMEREILIPGNLQEQSASQTQFFSQRRDYSTAYVVFHRTTDAPCNPAAVFVDLEIRQGEPYRLRRDGTIWGPSGQIVASVASSLSDDAAERFKYADDRWFVAARSGRLVTSDGKELHLVLSAPTSKKPFERPVAVFESDPPGDWLVLGEEGAWWASESFDTERNPLPAWGAVRGACRDPRGGILSVTRYGTVNAFGDTLLSEGTPLPDPAGWNSAGIDMVTDLALDPSGTSLYLLTRVGDIYRILPGAGMEQVYKTQNPDSSIWLALAAGEDYLLAMDWRGDIVRVPISSRSADL
ncbi:MAG: hypothetical protein ABIH23_24690 [bacterium]